MAQVINTNISSLMAQGNLNKSQGSLQTSLERLSSGMRINSAKDDAAGLAIANRFTSQIRGINQAMRNANDAISVTQVAEGAMSETTNLMQRMRELAIQSANGSNGASERQALQAEVTQLVSEVDRIATTTRFGSQKLLTGTYQNATFQVGAQANETISFSIASARSGDLGQINSVSFTGFDSSAVTGNSAVNGVTSQTLTLSENGLENTISVAAGASAEDIADQYNAVATLSQADAKTGAQLTLGAGDAQLTINGVDLGVQTGAAAADTAAAVAAAIQGNNSLSNLKVTDNGDGTIDIVDESGADISISQAATTAVDVTVGSLNADDTYDAAATLVDGENSVVSGTISFTTTETGATFALSSSDTGGGVTTSGDATTGAGTVTAGTDRVSTLDISTVEGAQKAIQIVDAAIASIDSNRADLGAVQNRLESTIANLGNVSENVSAARSRIQDADFAAETANLTKNQILQQAGISVLSQANSLPQQVLSLLQ